MEKERDLKHVLDQITKDMDDLIDWEKASSSNFGIGEEDIERTRSLSFSQLSEILTCLHVRDMLPNSISYENYRTITSHSAFKWFENLRNEELAKLAMKGFVKFIMETLECGLKFAQQENEPNLHLYSCHDSSLIGLMCAFKLQTPAQWPEYGSFLKIELFKVEETIKGGKEGETKFDHYVRFSLQSDGNVEVLRSSWGQGKGDNLDAIEARGMISLQKLSKSINIA